MIELLNIGYVGELLELGSLGFVVGVAFPFLFRITGGIVDSARQVIG